MVTIPLKVGDLYATLKLENKAFDSALDQSGQKFRSLGQAIGNGTRAFAGVFAATTAAAVGLGAAALKVGIDYNRMQQTSRAALTQLLGSSEAVNAKMAKLDEFAANSPFAKQVFIQAQQQLIGFGMAAEDVIPTLDAIQNAVASVGGSNEDIAEITRILATVTSSGKITAETLNQLGLRGVDAATLIGESMGKSGAEIRQEITKGTLDAGQAVDALVSGMSAKFGGATALVKQQMDGAVDRVKGAWRDLGAIMATPLVDPQGGGQLVEWTNLFADGLRQVGAQAKPVVDILWTRMQPAVDAITSGMQKANAAIAGWNAKGLEASLDKISGYAPLIGGVSAALFAMGTGNIPILAQLGIKLNPVVAGVGALIALSPSLRSAAGDFMSALSPLVGPATELARIVADFLVAALDRLAPAFSSVLTAGADVAGVFLVGLVPAVQGVANVALPLVGVVADLVQMIGNLPTPVLAVVAALGAMKALGITNVVNAFGKSVPGILRAVGSSFDTLRLQMMYASEGASGLGAAMGPAKAAVTGFGMAMKAAFVSNLPMLALTALVGVITVFSTKAAEAKSRADSYAAALKEVEESADGSAQALEEVARQNLVTGENADWGWVQKLNTGFDTAADAIEGAGISLDAFSAAVAGSEDEAAAMVDRINELRDAGQITKDHAHELTVKLGQQRQAIADAAHTTGQLESATQKNNDAQAAAAEAAVRAAKAVDRLRSAEQSLAAAKGDLIMAQYAAADALKAWADRVEEAGGIQRDQNGALVESGDAWRYYREGAIKSRDAMLQVAENMQKAGKSQSEIDAYIQEATQSWLSQSEAMGVTNSEAQELMDTIGGFPPVVATSVKLDKDAAQADADAFLAQLNEGEGTITIDARDDPAMAELWRALGVVDDGTGVFEIDADNQQALALLAATLGTVDTETGVLTIDGDPAEALARLQEIVSTIKADPNGVLRIFGRDLTQDTQAAIRSHISRNGAYMKINATDNVSGVADRIIRNYSGRTIEMVIGARVSGAVATTSADGNLFTAPGVKAFANGGVENRIAQIAPAGAWRIWAEPETGGEAYIPLALQKRARSLRIMDEVAARFGYQMVPAGARAFADGGGTGGSTAVVQAPTSNVSIGNITIPINQLEQLKSLEDFLDLLRVHVRMG